MMTAMQQSKIDVCLALTEAQRLLVGCRSKACVGREVRRELDAMVDRLSDIAGTFAPSNDPPPSEHL